MKRRGPNKLTHREIKVQGSFSRGKVLRQEGVYLSDGEFSLIARTVEGDAIDVCREDRGDWLIRITRTGFRVFCDLGDRRVFVGAVPVDEGSVKRGRGLWTKLCKSTMWEIRQWNTTVGSVMSGEKWDELMQGAEFAELLTDDELTGFLGDVSDDLDRPVLVTELKTRI